MRFALRGKLFSKTGPRAPLAGICSALMLGALRRLARVPAEGAGGGRNAGREVTLYAFS